MMKTVSFKTLGCRLNQYETDALVTQFHQAGYRVVDFAAPADITVINSCTVTHQSDQKSRNTISQAARKNNQGLVVVTGCMANNHKQQLEASEQVTYVVDNARKSQIVPLVDAHFKGEVVHPGDLLGQARRTLENMGALLAAGGASLADLLQMVVYLRDGADGERITAFLSSTDYPYTLVHAPVCRPGWLIEIEGIAVVPHQNDQLPPY